MLIAVTEERILRLLDQRETMPSVTAVSDDCPADRRWARRCLARLEAKGLVTRTTHIHHGRVCRRTELTERGRRLLEVYR